MSGIVAYGTMPLRQVLRGTLRVEDEEQFYWPLDENSRECMSTFKHCCTRCYMKGWYFVTVDIICFNNNGYW